MVTLAMYKGPGDKLRYKIFHYAVCYFTKSRYSHCELIIDGIAYSSSARDGGVRKKVIDNLNESNHWDLFNLPNIDRDSALAIFSLREGKGYDYLGIIRYLLPFLSSSSNRDYCSEIVSMMAGLEEYEKTPEDVFRTLIVDQITTTV